MNLVNPEKLGILFKAISTYGAITVIANRPTPGLRLATATRG
jgi:hypothetical protein